MRAGLALPPPFALRAAGATLNLRGSMSQLPPANPTPEGTAPVYEPAFEAAVQGFWSKNRQAILIFVVVVLLVIIGREAWQYMAAGRERGIRAEYAKAGDQSAKLESFAAAHSGHTLAGVAFLRIADEKFTAGDYKNAAANYQKAADGLKNPALLGRARIGAAISQLNSGDQAAGEAALKGISADAALDKGVRAEAAYHLAAMAAGAGKADDVKKYAEEASKVDATSSWAQRATMLVVRAPGAAQPAETAAPTLSFKPGGE
jgi:predicted negative regulator of RcsB-dependent stress response